MTEIQDRPARTRRRRGRTVTTVAVGLVLLALGGVAATAAADDGYVSLGAHGTYQTPAYALTSDSTDWHHQLLGLTGTVRIRVAPSGSGPLFVAVADPATVDRYLAGTRYTVVHSTDSRTEHDGAAPGSPGTVPWTASATGTGTQTLQWPTDAGEQVLVVMNADGLPSVRGRVESVAVAVSGLGWIAAGLLVVGAALLVGVVARRRREERS